MPCIRCAAACAAAGCFAFWAWLTRKLTDPSRVAWQLRYVEGYRLDEVAGLCHCSLATAKRRIADAEKRVHQVVHIEEIEDG